MSSKKSSINRFLEKTPADWDPLQSDKKIDMSNYLEPTTPEMLEKSQSKTAKATKSSTPVQGRSKARRAPPPIPTRGKANTPPSSPAAASVSARTTTTSSSTSTTTPARVAAATPSKKPRQQSLDCKWWSVSGEKVQVNQVLVYKSPLKTKISGNLVVTDYQICFFPSSPLQQRHPLPSVPLDFFRIPLAAISRVALIKSSKSSSKKKKQHEPKGSVLRITCKDIRYLDFVFPDAGVLARIHKLIRLFAFPLSVDAMMPGGAPPPSQIDDEGTEYQASVMSEAEMMMHIFAFQCFKRNDVSAMDARQSSWQRGQLDFVRQGALAEGSRLRPTLINMEYEFSPTYPVGFLVPGVIDDAKLDRIAAFRSRARVPAFCWRHANATTLWRCSQPRVGMQKKRCAEDEEFLYAICAICPSKKKLLIADCRPKTYAMANMANGKGFELGSAYPHMSLAFLGIGNIHDMRRSLTKLTALATSTTETDMNWLQSVEHTSWLQNLRLILLGAAKCARAMHEEHRPVLVHCSDGWDRTAQITALVQLMLDPYYRTIAGLQVLVEREWLDFGHQFQLRVGHGVSPSTASNSPTSPTFLQFLDCTQQLLSLYPRSFEYTSQMLIDMADHLYSCRFGTFLFNCQAQREAVKMHLCTFSLWDFLNNDKNRSRHTNCLFVPTTDKTPIDQHALIPTKPAICRGVRLWEDYFLRWSPLRGGGCPAGQTTSSASRYSALLRQHREAEDVHGYSHSLHVAPAFRGSDEANKLLHQRSSSSS